MLCAYSMKCCLFAENLSVDCLASQLAVCYLNVCLPQWVGAAATTFCRIYFGWFICSLFFFAYANVADILINFLSGDVELQCISMFIFYSQLFPGTLFSYLGYILI